jgi:alpha-glucosidase
MNLQIPFNRLTKAQRIMTYVSLMQGILDDSAIFSDETINYRMPSEPEPNEKTKVMIRTARENVDQVFLCFNGQKVEIQVEKSDDIFDYYAGEIIPSVEKVEYFFELRIGKLKFYYNKRGITREPDGYFNFTIVPGFRTPDWAKGTVMYQIFVDRFYNGDQDNDVVDHEYVYVGKHATKVDDWNKLPNSDGIREFYGGDLLGVMKKLDYLEQLGVQVLYLNPIFVSPSNHKYDTQDYDYVDPHYGKIVVDEGEVLAENCFDNNKATKYISRSTEKANLEASNQLFSELVEAAHQRGMKVILDGVFNHCGSFNKWLDREKIYENSHNYAHGAYVTETSPYNLFFYFHNKHTWPDNGEYDGWWGFDTLPKLNYEGSRELYNYILEIGKKWVSPPINADGWRLDVAADLGYSEDFNHKFWRDFRKAVKEAKGDAIILAEHYGDPSRWIQGDQWDTVMNYDAFMEPITWFLTGMEKHSDEYRADLLGNSKAFMDAINYNMARFQIQSLQVSMNELSNHDHSRFLTRTNHRVGRVYSSGHEAASGDINKGVMKEAVVFQMTWPGAPTIYYGDEVGLCGWTDPDNRRSFPWGNEDMDLFYVHKELISIRKKYAALRIGSVKFLYDAYNLISYGRWDDADKFVVIINNNEVAKKIKVPVWEIGVKDSETMFQLIETSEESYKAEEKIHFVFQGRMTVTIKPFSAIVLKNKIYSLPEV